MSMHESPHFDATVTLSDVVKMSHSQDIDRIRANTLQQIASLSSAVMSQKLMIYPEFFGAQKTIKACISLAKKKNRTHDDVVRWVSLACGLIDNGYRPNQLFKIEMSKGLDSDELKVQQTLEGMAKKIVDVYFYIRRQEFRFDLPFDCKWYEEIVAEDDGGRAALNLTVADEIARSTVRDIISNLDIRLHEQLFFSSTLIENVFFKEIESIRERMNIVRDPITAWVRMSGRNRRGSASNTIDKLHTACLALLCSGGSCTKAASLLTALYRAEVDRRSLTNEKRRIEKILGIDGDKRDALWAYKTIKTAIK